MNGLFNEIYKNLLSPTDSDESSTTPREIRRFLLVKLILLMTAFALFIFAGVHALANEATSTNIAIIDFIAGIVTLITVLRLRTAKDLDKTTLFATTSIFIFFIFFISFNQNASFGLIWLVFFPILALTMNSTIRGVFFAASFVITVSIMAYLGIDQWQGGNWDFKSFLRLSVSLSVFSFLVYIYEVTLDKAYEHEKAAMDVLHELSLNDHLTGIANRRRITNLLDIEFDRAQRYKTPFSIVLFDIDHFKKINDNYGHLAGDHVLKVFADQVSQSIRKTETIGRWGGEEFVLILSQTDLNSAYLVSEKIRKIIAKTRFDDIDGEITCSFGVASYDNDVNLDELIEQADQALYQAKENGRNQVKVYGQPNFKPSTDFVEI